MKWSDIVRVAAVLSFAHKALGFSQPAKSFARSKVALPSTVPFTKLDGETVDIASANNAADMKLLDAVVNGNAELTDNEFLFLGSCVAVAGLSPFLLPLEVTEVLVPVAAAIPAAVGVNCEYVGKISVANGKQTAAVTVQAAAECEAILAGAERSKAVTPLCAAIAVVGMAGAIFGEIFHEIAHHFGVPMVNEFYLIAPFVSVLSAAVAGLSYQETQSLCKSAIGTGTRRFAKSSDVGRTWLSETEMVISRTSKYREKVRKFALGMLPAPLLAAVLPGSIEFKAIVCAAAAAGQAHFYWANAEFEVSKALDVVAFKMRAAAISDTYGNQGARSGAILPFTSAAGAICAVGAAGAVELLSIVHNVGLQSILCAGFPAAAAMFAGAASVSKARAEVNAGAAKVAAESFATAQFQSNTGGAMASGVTDTMRGSIDMYRPMVNAVVNPIKSKIRNLFNRPPPPLAPA